MNPLDEKEIDLIMQEYNRLREEGNSELKSGWLSCSKYGFTDIIKQNKSNIQLLRREDNKYIIFSYSVEVSKPPAPESKSIVKIHTENNVFDGGGNTQ